MNDICYELTVDSHIIIYGLAIFVGVWAAKNICTLLMTGQKVRRDEELLRPAFNSSIPTQVTRSGFVPSAAPSLARLSLNSMIPTPVSESEFVPSAPSALTPSSLTPPPSYASVMC